MDLTGHLHHRFLLSQACWIDVLKQKCHRLLLVLISVGLTAVWWLTWIKIVPDADNEVRSNQGCLLTHHCCHMGLVVLSSAAPITHLQQSTPHSVNPCPGHANQYQHLDMKSDKTRACRGQNGPVKGRPHHKEFDWILVALTVHSQHEDANYHQENYPQAIKNLSSVACKTEEYQNMHAM